MLHLWNGVTGMGAVVGARKWLVASAAALTLSLPTASYAADDDRGRYDRDRTEWRRDRGRHDHHDRHDGRDRHRDDDRDHHHHDHHRHRDGGKRIDVDIRIGGGRPEYETRETRVWVPPVYRTVVDRRWVEPVYRTEVERVWVPERVEERVVRYCHKGHWHARVERVVVEPGHYQAVERRVCVREGRWETFERQELVCEGHYEVSKVRVRRPYRLRPFDVVNPMLGRVGVAGL